MVSDLYLTGTIRGAERQVSRAIPLGRKIRQFFARCMPVAETEVRGIRLKAILPLHQVGTYNEFMAWGSREPAVLDWLDRFEAPCTFMDVGANFGTESLYVARRHPQATVIACDPELIGSYNLAVNIALNGIANVENYVVALGDTQGWIEVAENVNYLYPFGRSKYAAARKRVRVETIDGLAARPVNYLKIDVDGLEGPILSGADRTLRDPALRSLVVEVDEPADRPAIRERLAGYGFALDPRYPGDTNNLFFTRATTL